MKNILRITLLAVLVFAICGCVEDISEITLNADGSGKVEQRFVLSERFIVAMSEDSSNSNIPVNKEELKDTVGDALDDLVVKQSETSDGGRVIEVEGTFKNAEQFFLSKFCKEHFKLSLVKVDENTAAIKSNLAKIGGDMTLSINHMYGLAKGMYIKRTFHLPGKITESNGQVSKDKKSVVWTIDLRDKQSLENSKPFLEKPNNGKSSVSFDVSSLEFEVPQAGIRKIKSQKNVVSKNGAAANNNNSKDFNARVIWVRADKKYFVENDTTEIDRLEIGVELTWQGDRPVGYKTSKLTSIVDEAGNDLIQSHTSKSRRNIHESKDKEEIDLTAKTPHSSIKELKNIQGYVDVLAESITEIVVLENILELASKGLTGNKTLDKINFKIVSVEDGKIAITAEEAYEKILSFKIIKADGNKVSRNGCGIVNDKITYSFAHPINNTTKFEMEILVSEEVVRVPFSLDKITLP